MAITWQRNADNWIGTTKSNYPQFEAWQADCPADNCWCLKIKLNADQEPIKVGEFQGPDAIEDFVAGFLKVP